LQAISRSGMLRPASRGVERMLPPLLGSRRALVVDPPCIRRVAAGLLTGNGASPPPALATEDWCSRMALPD
jgi:hypothetical protein